MTTQPATPNINHGSRIVRTALLVNDIDSVKQFYRDVIGLAVVREQQGQVVLGAGDTPLLILEEDPAAPARPEASAGLFHTAFRVPSREALGDALVRIRERWQLGGASDHWVSEAIYTSDPEGNGVEIYRDLPRDEWPLNADGTIQIGTHPLDLNRLAADATGASTIPAGADIGHIHLEVTSLDAFEAFYIDTVGFEVQTATPQAYFVAAGGYHHHLGANTWQHRNEPISGRGLAWFEILLPDADSLAQLQKRCVAGSYTVSETADGLTVIDADGVAVRFSVDS